MYSNIAKYPDWLTRDSADNTGDAMHPGIPEGIDPEVADTRKSNVTYVYDDRYPFDNITTNNILWYRTGAYSPTAGIFDRDGEDWEEQALPIGNGYMGGMVFGMPPKDHIQISEETFWAAGYKGIQQDNSAKWLEYARRCAGGERTDDKGLSTAFVVNKHMSEGTNGFMSAGNLMVDFEMPENPVIRNYYRDLNLDTGIAHVQYEYDMVTYYREYMASYPDETIAVHYSADRGNSLNFKVYYISPHTGTLEITDNTLIIKGRLKDSEPYVGRGKVTYECKSDLEYCQKIKVTATGGQIIQGDNYIQVKNADSAVVYVAAATDYDPAEFELNKDGSFNTATVAFKHKTGLEYAVKKATQRLGKAAGKDFDTYRKQHIEDYSGLFGRVKLSLTDEICKIPTDELRNSYKNAVNATYTGEDETIPGVITKSSEEAYNKLDRHLEELFYQYARYMMIASSREKSFPATLQGKWCQSVAEIWGSCYCININLQMNYWMAGNANLYESGKALVGWLETQIPAGQITARNSYGIVPDSSDERDGVFIMHVKQGINGTTDMTGAATYQSAGNTAWLMQNIWDLYETSGDIAYLREHIYPIMRKSANFYVKYLKQFKIKSEDTANYPDGFYYTTGPAHSPENGPCTLGIKYDLMLICGLFDYCIEAAAILQTDTDKVQEWNYVRQHMERALEIGEDGQLKEWKEECRYNRDKAGNLIGREYHRHLSHLVCLYPGKLVSIHTPEYLEGVKKVLERRGDNGKGWTCSFKMLLRARTYAGDKALEIFRFQLAQKVYGNLFDTHPPFQIDGNFGSAAGIMELLMQSHNKELHMLPALPKLWDKGSVSGLKTKTGATVDIAWENNRLKSARIITCRTEQVKVRCENAGMLYVKAEHDKEPKAFEKGIDGSFVLGEFKENTAYEICAV